MKRTLVICAILVAACLRGGATSQAPERLIVGGDTLRMWSYPLDDYFKSRGMTREDVPVLNRGFSTGLWRGYLGTWIVADNKLYLTRIQNVHGESVDLAAMFGRQYKNGRVLADWVTMDLYAQYGKVILEAPTAGVGEYYDKEKKVVVKDGKVLSIADYNTLTGGHDPQMVRIWNGRSIDQEQARKALEYIAIDGFKWDDSMTESMLVEVEYLLDDDLSYHVRGRAEARLAYATEKREGYIYGEKLLADAREKVTNPNYVAYVKEVVRILAPVRVETMLFCGKPLYRFFGVKLYFDATLRQIYRLEDSWSW